MTPTERLWRVFSRLTAQATPFTTFRVGECELDRTDEGERKLRRFTATFPEVDGPNSVRVEASLESGSLTLSARRGETVVRERESALDLSDGFTLDGKQHETAEELADGLGGAIQAEILRLRSTGNGD